MPGEIKCDDVGIDDENAEDADADDVCDEIHGPQIWVAMLMQGYGLTETCAASFLALPIGGHSGTVGPPTAGIELVFEGVEEMGCVC